MKGKEKKKTWMKRRKELGAKTHVGRFKIYLLSNCLSSAWRVLGTPLSRGDGTVGRKQNRSVPALGELTF